LGAIFIIRKLEVVIDDRRGLGNEGKESDIWKWYYERPEKLTML
jgi:hypothetical protein